MLNESNNNNFLSRIKDWINNNPGTTVGIIIGLIFGIFLFTLGVIKTIFLLVFMLIGYFLGRNRDAKGSVINFISRIFKKDE